MRVRRLGLNLARGPGIRDSTQAGYYSGDPTREPVMPTADWLAEPDRGLGGRAETTVDRPMHVRR
jgi:hypothetical protein